MPLQLDPDTLRCVEGALADAGLSFVRLGRKAGGKSYQLELVASDLVSQQRLRWCSSSIKYPRSCKAGRDRQAEAEHWAAWVQQGKETLRESSMRAQAPQRSRESAPAPPLPDRQKRPRDCQEKNAMPAAPLSKRGGPRPGGGRPRGSLGGKGRRKLLRTSMAELAQEELHASAQRSSRDVPAAMVEEPALALEEPSAASSSEIGDKDVAALSSAESRRACRESWEQGVTYFRAVEKACLGHATVVVIAVGGREVRYLGRLLAAV